MADRLKNLLLAVLLTLMVVLLGATFLLSMRNSQGGQRLLQALRPVEKAGSSQTAITAMAWPEKLAVLGEEGVFYAVSGEEYAQLYQQGEALCQEALGSADAPAQLTETEYRRLLQAPAILAEYHSGLPFYLLQAWSGSEELREALTVRRFALTKTAWGVALLLTDENGGRWQARTAASAAELEELCAQERQSNAVLAKESYPGLAWDELLLTGAADLPGYSSLRPDIVEKGELSQQVQALFSMNAYLARVYQNSSGSLVYVEGRSTLSLGQEGELIYAGAEGADLEISAGQEPQRTVEICQKVCALMRQVWSETGASGRLSLDSVRQENGRLLLSFALDVGGKFLEKDDGWAQVTVEDGAVTGASAYLRRLEPEEHALLLPMTEAAGMLAALPHRQARLCIRMTAGESGFAPGICRVTED